METALSAKQYARIRRKVRVKKLNEPPRLTVGEEVFNASSHGFGTGLAVAGLVLLLQRSDTPLRLTASCFYGVSMVVMMLMSSVYHAMPSGSRAKRLWRRFDYTSIYLLIGGTFAPILLVRYGGRLGVTLFCVQWAVILFGVTMLLVFGPGKWRPLHFTLYFLIGWSGLAFLPDMYRSARPLLGFILAGGLVYTLGMIPFAKPGKYNHCVWHVFVLAAAVLHWFGIYTQIYG
ncbi:hemolysin III family protein [uncultured Dysosmobacter sp.]|uniref:PAQR family membrane homeostasis protein TrhA n=1 Tax=uncultured Dysosmobacter sp. TaxID=2591384 RepID=UPI00260DFD3F|nr:hemolysin III family protein [uncultured Dysosmobacter sp.]